MPAHNMTIQLPRRAAIESTTIRYYALCQVQGAGDTKYKGPEIYNIEAHNERTKEKYASNPDIDRSRSKYNFHLIEPAGRYRAEAENQIQAAGCRTRTDSVRVVEVLFTATPEFFKGKKLPEVRRYFEESLRFFEQHQSRKTIIAAVVHMDEKTPHMHLSFVPLTTDGRLSAKEIVGNKKKLTWWQDKFWEHMVQKYPDLERGESASQTGRDHIPPRIFKEMTRLNKQRQKLDELLTGIEPLNSKKRAAEISKLLDGYIPAVEKMQTQLKKYKDAQLRRDYEDALALLERIPKEVLDEFRRPKAAQRTAEL